MSLCYAVGYKWVTVMYSVKFEFNDIISLYKKNHSEQRLDFLYCYYLFIIACKAVSIINIILLLFLFVVMVIHKTLEIKILILVVFRNLSVVFPVNRNI